MIVSSLFSFAFKLYGKIQEARILQQQQPHNVEIRRPNHTQKMR